MTTWFISRHPGAFEWAQEEGIDVDVRVEHLDVARIQAGDVVIGLLPLHLAAAVQRRGARYLHLKSPASAGGGNSMRGGCACSARGSRST